MIIEQIKEELMNNFDESSVNKKIANENDITIFQKLALLFFRPRKICLFPEIWTKIFE